MQRFLTTALILAATLAATPAFAQLDLAGNWAGKLHQDWEERVPGPEAVDYTGLPINDEARSRALTYSASVISEPERQCLYYTPPYLLTGPGGIKMWSESDPVTGKIVDWKISASIDRDFITIWMDGRPDPGKDAPHTLSGFTTGVWEGDTLVTTTTHMKAGYLRRNGVPLSDQAVATMRFSRHGDLMTIAERIDDPLYLTEPFHVTHVWVLDPAAQTNTSPAPCMPVVEVAHLGTAQPDVPHYLPGKNPFLNELTELYHIPANTTMGGADTMYPEYRNKLKAAYTIPGKCVRYCCGPSIIANCPGRY